MTQLRGAKLKARIEQCIASLSRQIRKGGTSEVLMTELAKAVPCSRTSLYAHKRWIETVLNESALKSRPKFTAKSNAALRAENERLAARVRELELQLNALYVQHTQIFTNILLSSLPVAPIFSQQARAVSGVVGRCVLCGSPAESRSPLGDKVG